MHIIYKWTYIIVIVIYLTWRYKTMWFCCGLTEMGSSTVEQQIQIAPSSSSAESSEWKKYGSILAANTKYQIHKIQELLGQFSFWTRRPILNLSLGVPGQNWVKSNWNIYICTYWPGIESKWKWHTYLICILIYGKLKQFHLSHLQIISHSNWSDNPQFTGPIWKEFKIPD